MALGVPIRNTDAPNYGVPPKKPMPGVFDAYQGAISQTGSDYDEIMGGYRNILSGQGGGGGTLPIGGGGGYSTTQPVPDRPNTPIGYSPTTAAQTAAPTNVNFNPTGIPNSILFNNTAAQQQQYSQSGDTTSALAGLKDLADTGGYTEEGKRDIRARGISPIRSAYAVAAQKAARGNNLQGGYSPNSGAVAAKMAREQAGLLSEGTTNVNAGLAQSIAANRLSAAPAYASASSAEAQRKADVARANADAMMATDRFNTSGRLDTDKFNTSARSEAERFNATGRLNADSSNAAAANDVAARNTAATNQANLFNAGNRTEVDRFNAGIMADNNKGSMDAQRYNNELIQANQARQDAALKGMTSLYGTTPALANTFGSQAMQQQSLDQQKQAELDRQKQQRGSTLINAYARG